MLGLNDITVRSIGSFEDEDDVAAEEEVAGDDIEFDPKTALGDIEEHPSGLSFDDLLEELEGEFGVTLDFDCYDSDSNRKIVQVDIAKHDFEDIDDLEECAETVVSRVSDWISGTG